MVVVDASTGVMNALLCKLSKLLEDEYSRLKGVRRQITFLRDELSSMNAVLETLADAEQLDPLKTEWRDKVRELSYDIEDCIDDFADRVGDDRGEELRTGLKGFFSKLRNLKARREIAGEIQQLKIRTVEASERRRRYDFLEPAPRSGASCAIDPRLPALYEDAARLVGIDGPKEHILGWFCKEKEHDDLKVLPIVGSGGLGKTTLANQVYCQLKGQFQCMALVSVSRNPNIQKILRQMLTEFGISGGALDDERQLIDRIRDHLKDKRYLVVIDDVWDVEAWKAIRLALFNNKCGSRIITTTRNAAVASYCSGDSSYVYQMESLNSADSRRLFFKRAFGSEEVCYPHLEEVSNQILAKCGGLPLAIITLSSLLADKHAKDEWNRVLTAIGSALANDPNAGNMTKILSLSYFDLSHHVRTCLLYLSVFPEDHRVDKQRLISRWVAEGFIHEEQGRSAYEVGKGYFNDLINKNLIQPVDVEYGQPKACRVHDIILDFITCKAAEENFVTLFDSVEHGQASDYRVRRLCVENRNSNKVTIPTSLILSHVRSLTVFGHCMKESLLTFPTLRVLDLGECWELENHHLANIGKLLHLKYLRLGQSRITELPRKIGELRYLETLDIRGTRIQELPPTIARLQRLAHLHVNHMIRFPDSVIGQMQSLEEVEDFGVFSYEQGKCLQEFSQLSKLRTLKVANGWSPDTTKRSRLEVIEGYLGTLLSSCNLRHLYFLDSYGGASLPAYRYPVSLESSCPTDTCILRKLHITYCYIDKVPSWMSLLENLRELNLYMFSMGSEDVAILGAIPSLLFLELRTFFGTNGRIVLAGFRSLKYFDLEIFCCGTLLEFEAGSMPNLEHLKLELRVHKMECLNGASDFGIHRLSTLNKVEISIYGDTDGVYDLYEDITVKCVASRLETAIEKLPNHPALSFLPGGLSPCLHFEKFIESYNRRYGDPMEYWRL
ncbi:hypothetical protein CFC21_108451 [Triticum aestivum]|uniref:AAA+ ATPase domain-containing protein n=2 Tax=Triticum aestivum TaxID=4565 RepID=A0A9R1MID4_WHEAT|nr:disease resistance protein RGA5-like [Triticum aestivum]KAF7107870.1 hypothetical protein CFC21_108451 [Triticum aestivum]